MPIRLGSSSRELAVLLYNYPKATALLPYSPKLLHIYLVLPIKATPFCLCEQKHNKNHKQQYVSNTLCAVRLHTYTYNVRVHNS